MSTPCSTTSTTCSKRMPKSSCEGTSKRAASNPLPTFQNTWQQLASEGGVLADLTNGAGRLPAAFLTPGISSFADFLAIASPELLPGRREHLPKAVTTEAPHGTTIV